MYASPTKRPSRAFCTHVTAVTPTELETRPTIEYGDGLRDHRDGPLCPRPEGRTTGDDVLNGCNHVGGSVMLGRHSRISVFSVRATTTS